MHQKPGPSILLVAVLLCTIGTASSVVAAPRFTAFQVFPVGSWPEAVDIGDVNGDGLNDVALTTTFYFDEENDNKLFIFIQTPAGGLAAPTRYDVPGANYAYHPSSVDIGDLTGDGLNDVAVATQDAVGVFAQNASGGLEAMVSYASGHSSFTNVYKLRIGDFNNDGRLDVASLDWGTQSMEVDVYLQSSSGTLDSPVSYYVRHAGYDDLEVGDVNGDGLTDIVVMSGQGYAYQAIGILYQNATGGFGPPVYHGLGDQQQAHGVAIGDLNSDGLQDVAVSCGGNRPSSKMAVFLQTGDGGLAQPVSYPAYDIPEPVEIADIDLDGRADLLTVHGGWDALGLFRQNAAGGLSAYELSSLPYASHYDPHGLAVGDINGDGAPDVATANYNYGLVVLYNSPSRLVEVTPTSHDFGEVYAGDASVPCTFTVVGRGRLAAQVGNVALAGRDPGHFRIRADGCSGRFLASGESCSVEVVYKPAAIGEETARLQIPYAGNRRAEALLTGTGVHDDRILTLVSPDGGERIPAGSTFTIQWLPPSWGAIYDVAYSVDEGAGWIPIADGLEVTSLEWAVPAIAGLCNKCRVRITARDAPGSWQAADVSDRNFKIAAARLLTPQAGDRLRSGRTAAAAWETYSLAVPIGSVALYFSSDRGRTWKRVRRATGNPLTLFWRVPWLPAASRNCRLKLVLIGADGRRIGRDVSDGTFTVRLP